MSTEQRFRIIRKQVELPSSYCGADFESEIAAAQIKLQFGQELTVRKASTRPEPAKCIKCGKEALFSLGKVILVKVPAFERRQ